MTHDGKVLIVADDAKVFGARPYANGKLESRIR